MRFIRPSNRWYFPLTTILIDFFTQVGFSSGNRLPITGVKDRSMHLAAQCPPVGLSPSTAVHRIDRQPPDAVTRVD